MFLLEHFVSVAKLEYAERSFEELVIEVFVVDEEVQQIFVFEFG